MISCLVLERPGTWRPVGVTALLFIAVLPAAPLVWSALGSSASAAVFVGNTFQNAVVNSLLLALCVAAVSLTLGLPLGVLTALYEFPGRSVLFALVTLPLLVPSFLWAIGWAAVTAHFSPSVSETLSGFSGCLLVLSAQGIPLVLLVSYAATLALSGSQIDAARLAGGEGAVVRAGARSVATPALLTAGLSGVLTLSDPGPGQIFGLATAASEVLANFAARYDFALAGRQCVTLTALVLSLATPLVFFLAPRLVSEVIARQTREGRRARHRGIAGVVVAALGFCVFIGLIAPLIGLTLPLVGGTAFLRAWNELSHTAGNTLGYAIGAGIIATVLGLLHAGCAGRSDRLRTVGLGIALGLLALPPAFPALGVVQLAAAAPAWADAFLRSRFTVCVALGLHFFPVAAVLGLRAWGATSATWVLAAGAHGVSLGTYLRRVMVPLLLPAGGVSVLLVALLATADITTVLLLHPPGERSLPLAIVTVMANAPESLVASLCLVYVTAAVGLLVATWTIAGRRHA
jgi:iron(III) transport system permease protein